MILFLVILGYALEAYFYILIANVLLSWLPDLKRSRIGQIISNIANPYMRFFRGLLVFGMMDFTPIIGFFLYSTGLRYYGEMVSILASR